MALTPASFIDDGFDFGLVIKPLKQHIGRPGKGALQLSPKRDVLVVDRPPIDGVQTYLYARTSYDERISLDKARGRV